MPDRPRVLIDKQVCPEVASCQRDQFKASFERWMTETYPAADGVEWHDIDGTLLAVIWRYKEAA